jgi:hypothetical protein
MDIHPQFGEIRTVKDFLIRFALIVLGVVVAVSVTQWREHSSRQKAASDMRLRLMDEVTNNAGLLSKVAANYDQTTKALEGVMLLCEKAMKAGKLDDETVAAIQKIELNLRTPSLVGTQWQLANANLALREFDNDEAGRFARAYAFQHFLEDVLMQHKPGTLSAIVEVNMLQATTSPEQTRTTCRAYSYLHTYGTSMRSNMALLSKAYGNVITPAAVPAAAAGASGGVK